jgi:hypothetical protein
MIYEYRSGAPVAYHVPAQVVGEQVEILAKRNGVCHPGALVDEARAIDSPLHPIFEWDDIVAAEGYREDQARHLIASIVVVKEEEDTRPPAFVHTTIEHRRGYATAARVLSDEELRGQLLEDTIANLRGWERRCIALGLTELDGVWRQIPEVGE